MQTTFTEGRHAAEFVLSEANRARSRDNLLLAASQNIIAGSILVASGDGQPYSVLPVAGLDAEAVGEKLAISLYNITTGAAENTRQVAGITRDAALAAQGIITR